MVENIESVKEFWTNNLNGMKFLDTFPETSEDFWNASALRYKYHYHLLPLFDRISEKIPGGKMLEIGCGMGDDSAQWAKRGMKITSMDLTKTAVECTKIRLSKCQLEGEVIQGNAESIDFPDNTFDLVYSFGVLHHSPDTPKTIDEIHRVLKPGGLASIMLYNRRSLNFFIHKILQYPFDGSREDPCPVENTYTKEEIIDIFSAYLRCDISIDYLFGTGYGLVNKLLPISIHRTLGNRIGWHLMIEAVK